MARIIVSFSGGKDSQATLIYAVKRWGADRVEAVFCDTGWEHPLTNNFVKEVCDKLGVKLTTLVKKRCGEDLTFEKLCLEMHCFPVPSRRACTKTLKIEPMVDWILEQDDNLIILQGIRAKESESRSKMASECMYFAEYFNDEIKGLYRKRAVKKWCKTHDASLLRPLFGWTSQEVIDYILTNGMRPNPLYERGVSRVGCFPCIMSRQREIQVVARDKEMRERLINLEKKVNESNGSRGALKYAGFFGKGNIPDRFCRTIKNGCPTAQEVFDYVTRDDCQLDMFEPEDGYSCMSLYHGLCE